MFYGLRNNGFVNIDEVESGLDCGCNCPCCGGRLVARKGPVMIHHFAHEKSSDCGYSETGLHISAKQILVEEKRIKLPKVTILRNHEFFNEKAISSERVVVFDRVEVEKFQSDIKPDIIGYIGDKKIYIEITVTHGIDREKIRKVQKQRVSLLEINLRYLPREYNLQWLKNSLIYGTKYKKWRHNDYAIEKEIEFLEEHVIPKRKHTRQEVQERILFPSRRARNTGELSLF